MKRAFIVLAMAGIYLWIRRKQQRLLDAPSKLDLAEAAWASEGGGNPSPLV